MMKFNKYIHQIWFQGEANIPSKFIKNVNKNKKIFNNWQYILWDNQTITAFLKKNNHKWLKKYNDYQLLHQKVDFARYCILYVLGGFYVDIDAIILKTPEKLLKQFPNYQVYLSYVNLYNYEIFVVHGKLKLLNNGVILAYPKSQFMLNLINNCPTQSSNKINNSIIINNTTGPSVFTDIANKSPKIKKLSYQYFEPCLLTKCNINDDTYTIHVHNSSWINPNIKKCANYYVEYRQTIRFIMICLFIYYSYKYLIKYKKN